MMGRTGGGLITNGRTQQQQPSGGLPAAAPMKPQQAQQPAPPPQQAAPQPQPQQGGMAPQGGENHIASNALRLLHDPQAAPEFEAMIAQGEKGAAQAVVTVGEQVVQEYEAQGQPIDPDQAADAMMMVLEDVANIGVNQGYLKAEPMIGDQPASVQAMIGYAMETWSQKFPEFGQEMMQGATDEVSPEDDAQAQQLAQYVGAQQQ